MRYKSKFSTTSVGPGGVLGSEPKKRNTSSPVKGVYKEELLLVREIESIKTKFK